MNASLPAEQWVLLTFEHYEADRVPIYTHVNNTPAIEAVTAASIEIGVTQLGRSEIE